MNVISYETTTVLTLQMRESLKRITNTHTKNPTGLWTLAERERKDKRSSSAIHTHKKSWPEKLLKRQQLSTHTAEIWKWMQLLCALAFIFPCGSKGKKHHLTQLLMHKWSSSSSLLFSPLTLYYYSDSFLSPYYYSRVNLEGLENKKNIQENSLFFFYFSRIAWLGGNESLGSCVCCVCPSSPPLLLLLSNLIISGCYFHQTQHASLFFFFSTFFWMCVTIIVQGSGERKKKEDKIKLTCRM